jgi:hypothetical protein
MTVGGLPQVPHNVTHTLPQLQVIGLWAMPSNDPTGMWHELGYLTINADGWCNPGYTRSDAFCTDGQERRTGQYWTER